MSKDRLSNKVIIATGAAGGIGRATALVFAREGAKVVVADVAQEAGEETAAMIKAAGGEAVFVRTDVSREADVAALVAKTFEHFGRIDAAFNNAGVEQCHKPIHELPLEEWQRVLAVDLTGVFLCLKHEIQAMLKTGGGAILNTASVLGQAAIPNGAEYVSSKHGVIGLTRAAAVEYAQQGIRVNALLPAVISTPMVERASADPGFAPMLAVMKSMHPMGRLGKSEEVAECAAWLLSDATSFVTGTTMAVDGGFLAV